MVILLAFLGCPGGGGTEKPPDTGAPGNRDSAETGDTGPDPNENDADGDGFTPNEGDCDDARAHVYPGAPDYCDGLDADCDGEPIPDGSCGEAGDPAAMWSWSIEGTEDVWESGVTRVGDVTGDGIEDVGVRILSATEAYEVYGKVLSGPSITSSFPTRAWTADGWEADWPTWPIESLDRAGDGNGDGLSDVWAITNTEGGQYTGAAFLFLGRDGGWTAGTTRVDLAADAAWLPDGGVTFVTGGSYGGAGEINGDGFADRIVYTYGATGELRWSLIEGSANPTGTYSLGELESIDLDFSELGAGGGNLLGDLDGDGLSDGAWRSGAHNTPSQIVYLGGSDWADGAHLADVASVAWDGSPTDGYGLYLPEANPPAPPGDIDGDGLDDSLLEVYRTDERFCTLVLSGGIPAGDIATWVTATVCSELPGGVVRPRRWVDDVDGDGSSEFTATTDAGYPLLPSTSLRGGGTFSAEELRWIQNEFVAGQYLEFTADLNGDGIPEWVFADGGWPDGEGLGRTLILDGFTVPWDDDSKW